MVLRGHVFFPLLSSASQEHRVSVPEYKTGLGGGGRMGWLWWLFRCGMHDTHVEAARWVRWCDRHSWGLSASREMGTRCRIAALAQHHSGASQLVGLLLLGFLL